MSARRYLARSTGFAVDERPGLAERRQLWLRQARATYELTRVSRQREGAPARAARHLFIWQALIGTLTLTVSALGPPVARELAPLALAVLVVGTVLLIPFSTFSLIAQDAVAEVGSKLKESWTPSPLTAGAYLAGKTAFFVAHYLTRALLVLPGLGAAAALSIVGPGQAAIVVLLPLAAIACTVALVLRSAADADRPIARSRGAFGASMHRLATLQRSSGQQAAQVAWLQAFGVIFGAQLVFVVIVSRNAPVGISSALTVLLCFFPSAAAISAFVPGVTVDLLGWPMPAWLCSLVLAAAWTPGIVSGAVLRWKAPDRATGWSLRAGLLLGLGVTFGLLVATLPPHPLATHFALVAIGALVPVIAAGWAGVTRTGDLGENAPAGWRRAAGQQRRTADAFGLVAASVVLAGAIVLLGAPLTALAACLVAAFPIAVFAATAGRVHRRLVETSHERGARASSALHAGHVVVGILSLALAAGYLVVGASAPTPGALPPLVAAVIDVVAPLSPIVTLHGALSHVLGTNVSATPGVGALAAGWLVQVFAVLTLRAFDRRAQARRRRAATAGARHAEGLASARA